jgi:hypothetical protein
MATKSPVEMLTTVLVLGGLLFAWLGPLLK